MTISSTPGALGIVGPSFRAGRLLQFMGSARHIEGGAQLNPGLALRLLPGADEPVAVAGCHHGLVSPLTMNDDGALSFGTIITPAETDTMKTLTGAQPYSCEVVPTDDGCAVSESTPAHRGYWMLLIPYPRDSGTKEYSDGRLPRHRGALHLRHGSRRVPCRRKPRAPEGFALRVREQAGAVRTGPPRSPGAGRLPALVGHQFPFDAGRTH